MSGLFFQQGWWTHQTHYQFRLCSFALVLSRSCFYKPKLILFKLAKHGDFTCRQSDWTIVHYNGLCKVCGWRHQRQWIYKKNKPCRSKNLPPIWFWQRDNTLVGFMSYVAMVKHRSNSWWLPLRPYAGRSSNKLRLATDVSVKYSFKQKSNK